jgi:hypothetical protein
MNYKSNFLKNLGLTGFLLTGMALSSNIHSAYSQDNPTNYSSNNLSKSSQNPDSNKVEVKQTVNPNNFLDYAITDIAIRDVAESYLEKLTKLDDDQNPDPERQTSSNYFKELIRNLGERNVIGSFSYTDHLCLELAMDSEGAKRQEDKTIKPISYEKAKEIAEEIIDAQYRLSTNTSFGVINYQNPNLTETLVSWVQLRTWEFQKLVNASNSLPIPDVSTKDKRKDYVRELYLGAFSRETITWYDNQQTLVGERIIESMVSTIEGGSIRDVVTRCRVRSELKKTRGALNQTRKEKIEKYFPKN